MKDALPCFLSVLIVDDDEALREAISDLLCFDGHCVEAASTALEASRWLVERAFDLILVDFEMPHMCGIEFLWHLRTYGCTVPVVLMTGCHTRSIVEQAISFGAVDILGKPFATEDLRAVVDRVGRTLVERIRREMAERRWPRRSDRDAQAPRRSRRDPYPTHRRSDRHRIEMKPV